MQQTASIGKNSATVLVLLLMLVMAATPLGQHQKIFLGGMTVSKVILPVSFVLYLAIRGGTIKLHPHMFYYLSMVVFTTISLLSGNGYESILLSFAGYFIIFLLLYNGLNSVTDFRRVILAYLLALALVSLMTIVAFLTSFDVGRMVGRPLVQIWYGLPVFLGTEGNPNGYATFFVCGVPIAFLFYITAESKLKRLFYLLVLVLLSFTMAMTFSRSAMAGAIIGSLSVYVYMKYQTRATYKLFVFIIILGFVAVNLSYLFQLVMEALTDTSDISGSVTVSSNKEESGGYRLLVLMPFFKIMMSNALFGVGYGNLPRILEGYVGLKINAHNIFFGIGLEFGLVALFFFLAVIVLSFRSMLAALSMTHDPVGRATIGCYFGSLAGLIFHGMFHEIYINFTLWFFIASGAALEKMVRQSPQTPADSPDQPVAEQGGQRLS